MVSALLPRALGNLLAILLSGNLTSEGLPGTWTKGPVGEETRSLPVRGNDPASLLSQVHEKVKGEALGL